MKLHHVTTAEGLKAISRGGVRPTSYWTDSRKLVNYYKSVIEDDGPEAVVISADLEDFEPRFLAPDLHSIDEPITLAIGKTEEEVQRAWSKSDKTWMDSLRIVRSVVYLAALRAGR